MFSNFRPERSDVDARKANHGSNMNNGLQFNGRSRSHQDLEADATSSLGALEWRTASQAEHLMTGLSEFLCDLYFRTSEYLYIYLYEAYRAVTRMSPPAAMVLKRLAPIFLSLFLFIFLLYVFITVFVNVTLAVNAGIAQYAQAIICNTRSTFLGPLFSVPPTILRHHSTRRLRIARFLISPTHTRVTQNSQSAIFGRDPIRSFCPRSIDKVQVVNEPYPRNTNVRSSQSRP